MRAVFSIVGLLLVALVIGLLVKKQFAPASVLLPNQARSAPGPSTEGAVTPAQQLMQIQQSLETTLQKARPEPADQ